MPSVLTRVLLFLSSYFPLTFIIYVLYVQKHRAVAITALTLGTIGLIGILIYFHILRQMNAKQIKVIGIQRRDGESMSYTVSYLVPFLALPSEGVEKSLALLVFVIVLCILYVNSNMIHINPMLSLWKYHLYEVTLEGNSVRFLITRERVAKDTVLRLVLVGDDICIQKEQTNARKQDRNYV